MTRLLAVTAALLLNAGWLAAPAAADDKDQPGFVGLQLSQEEGGRGPKVQMVLPGGPADKAGLKENDVLLKIGDKETKDARSAVDAVKGLKPGTKVKFHILRDGTEKDVEVTIGKRPAEPPPA
jgi:S1-C subfamily serine protease